MIRLKKYRRGNAGAEIRMHAYAYLYVKRIRMSHKIRDAGTILDKARQAEIESQREVKTNKRKKESAFTAKLSTRLRSLSTKTPGQEGNELNRVSISDSNMPF